MLLRLVAVIALLQGIAHGTLFLRARPRNGPAEVAVVEAMRGSRFPFGRSRRSYWDLYVGYGLEAAAVCFVEAALFWLLAGIAVRDRSLVKPIAALFLAANLGHIALVARYFFLTPAIPDALIALGLAGVLLAG